MYSGLKLQKENNNENEESPILKKYDFRSDTVTIPTPEMLQAMIAAPVGDDVKDEDPTVKKLQRMVADLCGKEDALFVSSGVLGNQLAIRIHITNNYYRNTICQTAIVDSRSHIYVHELGGVAFHSNIQPKPIIPKNNKYLTCEEIESNLFFGNDFHTPVTTLICLENTISGIIHPLEELVKIKELADKNDVRMHLDGARIWNACVGAGVEMKEIAKNFDSISMCLSKGLGAPIGSILVGTKDFIAKARQYRKLFGGGMRQVGNIAACGIYAIQNNWEKMKKDHENTRILHKGLVELGFEVTDPETNMLFLNSKKLNITFEKIIENIPKHQEKDEKILIEGEGYECRLVCHFQIPEEGVHRIIKVFGLILQEHNKK